MQIAAGARQGEVCQFGAPALAKWDDVFDVETGSLNPFVHQAILASPVGPRPNCTRQFFREAH